jgi:transmembrane sensor
VGGAKWRWRPGALFRVTHDAAIRSGGGGAVTITDVGTVFEVTRDEEAGTVDVIVSEGAVRVATPQGAPPAGGGNAPAFPAPPVPAAPRRPDAATLGRTLGWTKGGSTWMANRSAMPWPR